MDLGKWLADRRDRFNELASHSKYVSLFAERTKATPADLALCVMGAIFLIINIGLSVQNMVTAATFGYSAFITYRGIQSSTNTQTNERELLIFWICYSAFTCLESIASVVISYFPTYWMWKGVLLWLMIYPRTRLAGYIYSGWVKPFFDSYAPNIQFGLDRLSSTTETLVKKTD
jgi:Protein involved in membrane traffic